MIKQAIFAVILAIVIWRVVVFVKLMGFLKHFHIHHPGPCRALPVIERGAEDGVLLADGKLLISSGLRFLHNMENPNFANVKGQIYLFDMNKLDKVPRPLLAESDMDLKEFNPHGMDDWTDKHTGMVYLYVVNHKATESVVERFAFDPQKLTLAHEVTFGSGDPSFRFLNDVVVMERDVFYFTNMLWYRSRLELYSALPWGTVGYFDGSKARVEVASGLVLGNGIETSPDKRFLYVASMGSEEISIYGIGQHGKLQLKERVNFHVGVDNLYVDDANGDLWVAGHPQIWRTADYTNDPVHHNAPAQVLRAKVQEGAIQQLTAVLSDDGSTVSGSSVAVPYKDKLFIGSIVGKAFICDLKYY